MNKKYHDDNMVEPTTWRSNDDQPFGRGHPLELYIPKAMFTSIVEAQIATVEKNRVPIIESAEETAFIDNMLSERKRLLKWIANYQDTEIFVQMSPHSEFTEPEFDFPAEPPDLIH